MEEFKAGRRSFKMLIFYRNIQHPTSNDRCLQTGTKRRDSEGAEERQDGTGESQPVGTPRRQSGNGFFARLGAARRRCVYFLTLDFILAPNRISSGG